MDRLDSEQESAEVDATKAAHVDLWPSSLDELVDGVRSAARVLPVGGGTKPRLTRVSQEVARVQTKRLSGVLEYEPGEFTITAFAGTALADIESVLAEKGQYLPFDPVLLSAGSTLGGAIAAGVAGPGRHRFGGIRDFLLGVKFVDGTGRLLRMGGKVVKNAAGFDLPKFFVGSLGRWGILAEATFKVFPKPQAIRTLALDANGTGDAARVIGGMAVNRWELGALEVPCAADRVLVRLEGPRASLDPLAREILARWPGRVLADDEAGRVWEDLRELRWRHVDGSLCKVPVTPTSMPAFDGRMREIDGVRIHYGSGGSVAYLSAPPGVADACRDLAFRSAGVAGLNLAGDGPLWWGDRRRFVVEDALKRAIDPDGRFVSMDD